MHAKRIRRESKESLKRIRRESEENPKRIQKLCWEMHRETYRESAENVSSTTEKLQRLHRDCAENVQRIILFDLKNILYGEVTADERGIKPITRGKASNQKDNSISRESNSVWN
jgi:hypothetical protein